MVKFFAPWCGHCKRLAPIYEEAATVLKGTAVLAEVDCVMMVGAANVNANLCSRFGVQGYPTLKVFMEQKAEVEYQGGRTADDIVTYMTKLSEDPYTILSSADEVAAFTAQSGGVAVVGVFADTSSSDFAHFVELAASKRLDHPFGVVLDVALVLGQPVEAPAMLVYKDFDDKRYTHTGVFTVAALTTTLEAETVPLLAQMEPEHYSTYVDRGHPIAWVFMDTAHADTIAIRTAATEAAKEFKNRISFVAIDAVKWNRHARAMGVHDSPALAVQSADTTKTFLHSGEMHADAIVAFCKAVLSGKAEPTRKSEPVPMQTALPLFKLVGSTFDEVAFDSRRDVLVAFVAPWCGHCKHMGPAYQEVAETMAKEGQENIVIASIDAAENEVPYEHIGYPTLTLFPAGDKQGPAEGVLFGGERKTGPMLAFIKEHATTYSAAGTAAAPHAEL